MNRNTPEAREINRTDNVGLLDAVAETLKDLKRDLREEAHLTSILEAENETRKLKRYVGQLEGRLAALELKSQLR